MHGILHVARQTLGDEVKGRGKGIRQDGIDPAGTGHVSLEIQRFGSMRRKLEEVLIRSRFIFFGGLSLSVQVRGSYWKPSRH